MTHMHPLEYSRCSIFAILIQFMLVRCMYARYVVSQFNCKCLFMLYNLMRIHSTILNNNKFCLIIRYTVVIGRHFWLHDTKLLITVICYWQPTQIPSIIHNENRCWTCFSAQNFHEMLKIGIITVNEWFFDINTWRVYIFFVIKISVEIIITDSCEIMHVHLSVIWVKL